MSSREIVRLRASSNSDSVKFFLNAKSLKVSNWFDSDICEAWGAGLSFFGLAGKGGRSGDRPLSWLSLGAGTGGLDPLIFSFTPTVSTGLLYL